MGRKGLVYLSLVALVLLVIFIKVKIDSRQRILGVEDKRQYLLLKNSPVIPLSIEETINLGEKRQVYLS